VTQRREQREGPLREFIDQLHEASPPLQRVPGTAVFLNRSKTSVPLAMRANVEHNHILHRHVVILSIETLPVPHVPISESVSVDGLGHSDDGIIHVDARFGYMQTPDVPAVLRLAAADSPEMSAELEDTSYFLSTIELGLGDAPGMTRWRKRLFIATSGITADAAEYFSLPRDRVVIMGSRIDV
jgi:KUP system potassium uptake protein